MKKLNLATMILYHSKAMCLHITLIYRFEEAKIHSKSKLTSSPTVYKASFFFTVYKAYI